MLLSYTATCPQRLKSLYVTLSISEAYNLLLMVLNGRGLVHFYALTNDSQNREALSTVL
jgi:hypothetical protein